jgi:hypothetical protein
MERPERSERRQRDLRNSDGPDLKVYSYRLSAKEHKKVKTLAVSKGWTDSDAIRAMIKAY